MLNPKRGSGFLDLCTPEDRPLHAASHEQASRQWLAARYR
jgi:hypothetical protein